MCFGGSKSSPPPQVQQPPDPEPATTISKVSNGYTDRDRRIQANMSKQDTNRTTTLGSDLGSGIESLGAQ